MSSRGGVSRRGISGRPCRDLWLISNDTRRSVDDLDMDGGDRSTISTRAEEVGRRSRQGRRRSGDDLDKDGGDPSGPLRFAQDGPRDDSRVEICAAPPVRPHEIATDRKSDIASGDVRSYRMEVHMWRKIS